MGPQGNKVLEVQWRINLPLLWYILAPAIILVPLLPIYIIFRSLSLLLVESLALLAVVFVALFSLCFIHPLHFGKRSYTEGQLELSNAVFGIRQSHGRHFTYFDLNKSRIGVLPDGTANISDLHAVLVSNGIPVGEVSWTWWKTSISLKFQDPEELALFIRTGGAYAPSSNS